MNLKLTVGLLLLLLLLITGTVQAKDREQELIYPRETNIQTAHGTDLTIPIFIVMDVFEHAFAVSTRSIDLIGHGIPPEIYWP